VLQPLSRAMELEKAAACKIQTAASKGSLAFFQNVLYKGYTLYPIVYVVNAIINLGYVFFYLAI
ncbi:hypothetical protein LSPCS325_53850, partial [Lysinibacillus sp. CTST325]